MIVRLVTMLLPADESVSDRQVADAVRMVVRGGLAINTAPGQQLGSRLYGEPDIRVGRLNGLDDSDASAVS